jgi:membrane fusion protein (multidrug efflux system)
MIFSASNNSLPGGTIEEKIKNMPEVELLLPDGSIYSHKGRVQLAAGQFDNSIGAINFRAIFPNKDKLLRSGNTGKVRIAQLHNDALIVPQEATFEIQDKVFVLALGDSNKVRTKPIVVGGKTSYYYFVEDGIQVGERIIFAGGGNVRDGMVIHPHPMSADSLLKVKPI